MLYSVTQLFEFLNMWLDVKSLARCLWKNTC